MRPAAADATEPSRRQVLGRLLACGVLPVLAGCDAARATGGAERGGRDAALLLPLTGAQGQLGQKMAEAASLAATGDGPPIFDTADTAAGAAAAAAKAVDGGARVLFGPLRADQTPAVVAAVGRVPVVTFSNDDALAAQGAFVMGMTPAQSIAATFSYAKAQGLTRIALVATDTPIGAASVTAARSIAAAGGLTLGPVLLRSPGAGGLAAAVRAGKPQAVFIPDGGAALDGFARALSGSGLQLLGGVQWGSGDVEGNASLAGAWFAAPPPDLFAPFADRFAAEFGAEPGVVAALAHDAALIATGLGANRALNRKGLLRPAGFTGVLGSFRFLADGRCQRDLAILTLEGGQVVVLGEVAGT